MERFVSHDAAPRALSWAAVVTAAAKLDGVRREYRADDEPHKRYPSEYALPREREAYCPSRSERLSYAGGGRPNPSRKVPDAPIFDRVVDTLNALESHPYVVEYKTGEFKLFRNGREARHHARFIKGTKIHYVCMIYRTVRALDMRLPSPDKRMEPIKTLGSKMRTRGEGTKVVSHKVPVKLTSVRVY